MRSLGPGDVPLYPTVLTMRLGANSTVMGAIWRENSVLATSCAPAGARKDCVCWAFSRAVAAARPAILRKSRLCMERGRNQNHGNRPRRLRPTQLHLTTKCNMGQAVFERSTGLPSEGKSRIQVLQGTLDLIVLRTLASLG